MTYPRNEPHDPMMPLLTGIAAPVVGVLVFLLQMATPHVAHRYPAWLVFAVAVGSIALAVHRWQVWGNRHRLFVHTRRR